MANVPDLEELSRELHKPAKHKFPRRQVFVAHKHDIWSIDLVDMKELLEHNEGFRYLLTCIDIGTRYAWAEKIKEKTGKSVLAALQRIVKKAGQLPGKIWADQGSEFFNREVQQYLDGQTVLYNTWSDKKAVFIERFNRTLKTRMWQYFTSHQTRRWIDILDDLIDDYNKTVHSSIGMSPAAAMVRGYTDMKIKVKPRKTNNFEVGDKVRISRQKGHFEKGYTPNWSYEVFTVRAIRDTVPVTYVLEDELRERIKGGFYEEELQKTNQKDTFLVETVLDEKRDPSRRGKKLYLVKWLGYSDKHNTWVREEDLGDLPRQR